MGDEGLERGWEGECWLGGGRETSIADGAALCGIEAGGLGGVALGAAGELRGMTFEFYNGEFGPGEVEGVGMVGEGVVEEAFEVVVEVGGGGVFGEELTEEGGEVGGGLHGAPVGSVGVAGLYEGTLFGSVQPFFAAGVE